MPRRASRQWRVLHEEVTCVREEILKALPRDPHWQGPKGPCQWDLPGPEDFQGPWMFSAFGAFWGRTCCFSTATANSRPFLTFSRILLFSGISRLSTFSRFLNFSCRKQFLESQTFCQIAKILTILGFHEFQQGSWMFIQFCESPLNSTWPLILSNQPGAQ